MNISENETQAVSSVKLSTQAQGENNMTSPQNLGGPRIALNNPQAAAALGETVQINVSTDQPKVLTWKVTGIRQEKLVITNPNSAPKEWTTKPSEKWLQLNPSTGQLAAGESKTIDVGIDTTGLAHGSTASVHFSWTNYTGRDNGDTLEVTF